MTSLKHVRVALPLVQVPDALGIVSDMARLLESNIACVSACPLASFSISLTLSISLSSGYWKSPPHLGVTSPTCMRRLSTAIHPAQAVD